MTVLDIRETEDPIDLANILRWQGEVKEMCGEFPSDLLLTQDQNRQLYERLSDIQRAREGAGVLGDGQYHGINIHFVPDQE